jgi:hypothetical protein
MQILAGLWITLLGVIFQAAIPTNADDILAQLSKIRLDKKQIYVIRDVTIRRDVLTIAFNRGALAFLEPVNGKVTGAVFIGSGEIVALPPNAIDKQQIYKFTGTPVLNEAFETAIFRFTDNTYEELRREISQHAQEDVSAEDAAEFDPWETAVAARATILNLRLLADFLEPAGKALFLGELKGTKTGWFNVAFDMRATEEVSLFKIHEIGPASFADIWASFNQRSETRNPEAVAHENKAPIDILSYDITGSAAPDNRIDAKVTMQAKARTDGARVLTFDFSPTLRITSVLTGNDEPVQHYQNPNSKNLTVVLGNALKPDQEFTLRFDYSGEVTRQGPWYPSQLQESIPSVKSSLPLANDGFFTRLEYAGRKVAPASYHDQWLIDSLSRYIAVMTQDGNPAGAALRKFLTDARNELKPVEGAGPIWLGPRLASTVSPDAYRAVYDKGVWVVHMLRMILRQEGSNPDAKFLSMLQEFVETYDGKTASTWDLRRVAEKHSGKKLDWFFDQWVFGTGVPAYSADYKLESSGTQFTIQGTITQTGVPDGFIMPVPVYADGDYLGTVQVGESDGQFKFRVEKKPERLAIDPEMTILTN